MKLPCRRHGSAVHSLPSVITVGGGGGGGGSDGEEGCFAVATGGRREGPGGRNCRSHMGGGVVVWGRLIFCWWIKGHSDGTNGARGGLADAINQGGNQYTM